MRRFLLIVGWLAASSIADRAAAQTPVVSAAVVPPTAPLTPVDVNPPPVSIDELPVAPRQGAHPRFALAAPLGEALESAFLVMPGDTEAAFLMRGKHLQPPREPQPAGDVFVLPPLRRSEFDLNRETEQVRVGLYYMSTGGLVDLIEPIGAHMRERDVLWAALPIRNIVNTLAIGFSGGGESYTYIAFREPLDEAFFESLRPQTMGVHRIRGVDVIRYEPEAVARAREHRRAINSVAPNTVGGPAGPPSATPPPREDDDVYLVPLAPNALAVCSSEKEAENVLAHVCESATFSKLRPAWLTWDEATTFVGFNTFRNRGKDAAAGTLAAVDPNARGIVVRWSQQTPQHLQFVYATDLIDPTPLFETAMKGDEIYGRAHYQPHPQGVAATMVLGERMPGDRDPLEGGAMCMYVYHLCGMIILP